MNQYRVSAAARVDLDDNWIYIAQDNPEAADRFIHATIVKFKTLAEWPHWEGRARSYPRACGVG